MIRVDARRTGLVTVGRDMALFLTTWATGGNLHED